MNDPLETPDRRPLVYGGVAIVIFFVAAFLFWPRGEQTDPMDGTSLTPRTTTQASDDAVSPTSEEPPVAADVNGSGGTDVSGLGEPANPRAETRIVDDSEPAARSEITPPPPVPEEAVEERAPQRVETGTGIEPASQGEWVLNVGSFSSRGNADRRVEELARRGIDAHVQMASADQGDPVYRVRVGYFGSSQEARSYGEWLRTSQDLDSWASKR
ncbi:MAG TPA: SPOR domain-containing protein [Candidatus Krumholzibacteria bacterium]|nr:SPOR domain-containing protein [Candidatus Krumholzibacteria bacterium]